MTRSRKATVRIPFPLVASYLAAVAACLFADFGWRLPYVIMSLWLSGAFLVMAMANTVIDFMLFMRSLEPAGSTRESAEEPNQ